MSDWTEDPELIRRVTAAVRLADAQFEQSGGSSRHWVRECLLPCLDDAGLQIVEQKEDPNVRG